MKTAKRIFSMFLLLAMVFSLFSGIAYAAEEPVVEEIAEEVVEEQDEATESVAEEAPAEETPAEEAPAEEAPAEEAPAEEAPVEEAPAEEAPVAAALDGDTNVARIGDTYYTSLADAVAAAKTGNTVTVLADVKLAARVDTEFTGVIDLDGYTLSSTETCGNGSVFNVVSGTVTIKNGKMVGIAGPTGLADPYTNECDVITVRGGATANLEDLTITVDSVTGACVYAFDGGEINIFSGTYTNNATSAYANDDKMTMNQADHKEQAIFVYGGTFNGANPAAGDNSGDPATFLAKGYTSVAAGVGSWKVSDNVAKIGDTYYATLAAAVAAAKNGDTITVLADVKLADRIDTAFSGVIDLDGYTLSSTATCGNGSVFNVVSGVVTIKNGTMVGIAGPTGLAAPYTNECDVITVRGGATANLEDLTITVDSVTGACVYAFDGGKINIFSGTYTNNATSAYANDDKMTMNQADHKEQAIFVYGGTFNGANPAAGDNSGDPATFLAEGYQSVEETAGTWTVSPAYVARIGRNTYYDTLEAAADAAKDGQTITMLTDYTPTDIVKVVQKTITIDLAGHTISREVAKASTTVYGTASSQPVIWVGECANLTMTDSVGGGKVEATSKGAAINVGTYSGGSDEDLASTLTLKAGTYTGGYAGCYAFYNGAITVDGATVTGGEIGICVRNAGAKLTVKSGTVTNNSATEAAIEGNGNDDGKNTKIIIEGGTITGKGCGIYQPQDGTLSISGGTITGATSAVEVRAGEVEITGGTLTSTAESYSCNANGNGFTTTGAALAIAQHTTKKDITATISGGTFTGEKAISESNPQANAPAPRVTMNVTGGKFKGNVTLADVKNCISGGIFSADPDDTYVAEGYEVAANTDSETKTAYPKKVAVDKIIVNEERGDNAIRADVTTNKDVAVSLNDDNSVFDSNAAAKEAVEEKTSVTGVELTQPSKSTETGTGLQKTIAAAMNKKGSAIKEAIEAAGEKTVDVKVNVEVVPVKFVTTSGQEAVSFELNPVATVTVEPAGGEEVSETVDVEDAWIDQTQDITVCIYTGFKPAQIVHRETADGAVIETFEGSNVNYDEDTGVVTLTIHHFSVLEANATSQVDTKLPTFAANITLSENIAINVHINGIVASNYPTFDKYKVYVGEGDERQVVPFNGSTKSNLSATVGSYTAAKIDEAVTFSVYYGDTLLKTFTYSVKKYCDNRIASSSSTEQLKDLCKAVLLYGAAAKDYTRYNGAEAEGYKLISDDVNDYTNAMNAITFNEDKCTFTNCGSDASMNMKLGTDLAFNVYFDCAMNEDGLLIVSTLNDSYLYTKFDLSSDGKTLTVSDIPASRLSRVYTLKYNANGLSVFADLVDADNFNSADDLAEFNALGYLKAAAKEYSGNGDLVNLCKALYYYGITAESYAAAN